MDPFYIYLQNYLSIFSF